MSPTALPPRVLMLGAILMAASWSDVGAQQATPPSRTPALQAGPTHEARAVTARSLLDPKDAESPSVFLRYDAFQRDFARSFGYPVLGLAAPDSENFWSGLERWLDARWGDSAVTDWVERGLLLYARVQATTHFERRGFNMKMDVDDVAEGKFGVRVSRSLDRQ
ncbi:MAG TPA: hypothetical protein VJP59_10470 [Gemmatimonadota bacterium]|nr:hypothetical protein [Gemmatimonadota bacterium]